MQLNEAIVRMGDKNFTGDFKKRFACAHCGKTWVEIVGLFVGAHEGSEDLVFQFGTESEACQSCRNRPRSCPKCGSRDAYEIKFASRYMANTPFSFDGIRLVSRG